MNYFKQNRERGGTLIEYIIIAAMLSLVAMGIFISRQISIEELACVGQTNAKGECIDNSNKRQWEVALNNFQKSLAGGTLLSD